ncbi:MAG: hypothetical protein QOF42_3797, partial [Gammaproteobacteria bacterium]|nr:hypothetical protein [Gammaproteobacteria bacterium]
MPPIEERKNQTIAGRTADCQEGELSEGREGVQRKTHGGVRRTMDFRPSEGGRLGLLPS